ncbi:MAG: hypothetical protein V5A23_00560 [Halobacteriales archaeon]
MSDSLVVHLNRGELHEIAPETDAFEADGAFEVAFRNHGRAVHVHVKLEGPLSHVAALEGGNHFVGTDETEVVEVEVDDRTAPIEGWLEVATGYGSEQEQVAVSLGERSDPQPVEVDRRLGDPPEGDAGDLASAFASEGRLRVAGLIFGAVVLAAVAVAVAPSVTVGFGAAVVVGGAAVGAYMMWG